MLINLFSIFSIFNLVFYHISLTWEHPPTSCSFFWLQFALSPTQPAETAPVARGDSTGVNQLPCPIKSYCRNLPPHSYGSVFYRALHFLYLLGIRGQVLLNPVWVPAGVYLLGYPDVRLTISLYDPGRDFEGRLWPRCCGLSLSQVISAWSWWPNSLRRLPFYSF